MKALVLLFLIFSLTACSTPRFATYTAPNGGKLVIAGSGSLAEDSDYEEEDLLARFPDMELRLRSKKHGKRQTTVPNNYIAGSVTKFLATESTNVVKSNDARDVKLGAQAADVEKAGMVPTVTEAGQKVTFPR
jgi:hypothetical protein